MSLQSNLYARGNLPAGTSSQIAFVYNELLKIQQSIAQLSASLPQAASSAPDKPQMGWLRLVQAPWNPLGDGTTGEWVYWTGTAWAKLP